MWRTPWQGPLVGPRVLAHMVDAVLQLEGKRFHLQPTAAHCQRHRLQPPATGDGGPQQASGDPPGGAGCFCQYHRSVHIVNLHDDTTLSTNRPSEDALLG